MIKKKWYPWLTNLYIKIINSKLLYCNNCSLIISYSCSLGVDLLVFNLVKWIFCIDKKKNNFCDKCYQCNLINFKNHPNFFSLFNKTGKEINICSLKDINNKLLYNISFVKFKVVYLSNYDFSNDFVNNFLLKILEEFYYKIIFIFSCFDYFNIPTTILSRCHKYKLFFPKEEYIYEWIINKKNINLDRKSISTAIRLSNNSPLFSIRLIKNLWVLRLNLFQLIFKMSINKINFFIEEFDLSILNINIFWLLTLFIDVLKYKLKYLYYLYNLDNLNLIIFLSKRICIKNLFLILKSLFFSFNKVNLISNINKKILLYSMLYNIYYFINFDG